MLGKFSSVIADSTPQQCFSPHWANFKQTCTGVISLGSLLNHLKRTATRLDQEQSLVLGEVHRARQNKSMKKKMLASSPRRANILKLTES